MKKKFYVNANGITVAKLKQYLRGLPEVDKHGEPYEVWLQSGTGVSSVAKIISPMNEGDLLFEYSFGDDE